METSTPTGSSTDATDAFVVPDCGMVGHQWKVASVRNGYVKWGCHCGDHQVRRISPVEVRTQRIGHKVDQPSCGRIYGAVPGNAKPDDLVGKTINYITLSGNMGVGITIQGWEFGCWIVRNNDSRYTLNPERMVAVYVYGDDEKRVKLHEGDKPPFGLAFKAGRR